MEILSIARKRKWLILSLVIAAGLIGTGAGMIDSRFGLTHDFGQRLQIASKIFLTPESLANRSRGSGNLYMLDDCTCRRIGWKCPCSALAGAEGPARRLLVDLKSHPNPVRFGPTENFRKRLLSATGYDRITPHEKRFIEGRRETYLGGDLREIFFRYERPQMAVRGLFLTHTEKRRRSLFLHTPASWTIAETPLGIGNPLYLRSVAKTIFEAGHDVVTLDHGSNGHIETAYNGYSVVTAGVQTYGLWARSTCDAIKKLESEGRQYDKIAVYGLSRGNRTVLYIRGLCEEIDFAFGDDTWSHHGYVNDYWRSSNSLIHASKYGALFHHAEAFIGHATAHDLAQAAANKESKLILFMKHSEFRRVEVSLQKSFKIIDGIDEEAAIHIVEKRQTLHEPENEAIVEFLKGDTSQMRSWSLIPKVDLQQ